MLALVLALADVWLASGSGTIYVILPSWFEENVKLHFVSHFARPYLQTEVNKTAFFKIRRGVQWQ